MRSIVRPATPLVAALAFLAAPAPAQVIDAFAESLPGDENDYLLLAPPPDPRVLSGHGVRVGDVTIQPVLTESTGYSSNPLGISPSGSGLLETNGSLGLATDWLRDVLDATFSFDNTQYFSRPLADETDWTAALAGSLDVGRSKLDAGYSHLALNLDPEQLGTLGLSRRRPTPTTTDGSTPISCSDACASFVSDALRPLPSWLDVQRWIVGVRHQGISSSMRACFHPPTRRVSSSVM